jgi:HTH-type transcriptional regulator/antitoxin HigA
MTPTLNELHRADARFWELLRRFPLLPLQSEADLDAATEVIHELIDQDALSPAEDDYLDILSDLVYAYEEVHYPMPDVPPHEMLAELMESKGHTPDDGAAKAGIAAPPSPRFWLASKR